MIYRIPPEYKGTKASALDDLIAKTLASLEPVKTPPTKIKTIAARVSAEEKASFTLTCQELGLNQSEVLRSLIVAYLDAATRHLQKRPISVPPTIDNSL